MTKIRNISPLDCGYLAADTASSSPMVNQYVVEGIGNFSYIELRAAIEEVSEKNLGVRLRLKGRWFWRYWDSEGESARLLSHKENWSADSSQGAIFDGALLNCRLGECVEIHYFEGTEPKLVFRTHHAIMDGNATLFWIKEIFRALRAEPLLGSDCDLNEYDLAARFKKPELVQFSGPWLSVFPKSVQDVTSNEILFPCHWQNVILKGSETRVLAKVISFINQRARLFSNDGVVPKVVVRIPSDLRRLLPVEQNYQLGNLVAALDLEIEEKADTKIIYKKILAGLQKNQDIAVFTKALKLAKFLPKSMFLKSKQYFTKIHKEGLADITAIVTHVGRVSLKEFSNENFKAQNIYAVPVPLEGVSISCVFVSHEGGLSLCLSAPKILVSQAGLKDFAKEMQSFIDQEDKLLSTGKA